MRSFSVILCSLLVAGCVVGRQARSSVAEQDLYRRSRVARTLEQRLAAAHAYRDQYPDGAWRPEVDAWLKSAAEEYYEAIEDDAAALRGYLTLLPADGLAVQRVKKRLAELQVAEDYRRATELEFDLRAAEIDCELTRAAQRRQAVVERIMMFARHISAIRSWSEPTSSLDHEFIHEWRIRPPRARCQGGRCVKTVMMPYAIPEARELSERVAIFDVVVELERGGVRRATIAGPELFSRLAEAIDLQIVTPDDANARLDAMTTAFFVVQNALEDALPAAECESPPVSPALIVRECRGVRAAMIAGRDASEEDRIVVEPITPP